MFVGDERSITVGGPEGPARLEGDGPAALIKVSSWHEIKKKNTYYGEADGRGD